MHVVQSLRQVQSYIHFLLLKIVFRAEGVVDVIRLQSVGMELLGFLGGKVIIIAILTTILLLNATKLIRILKLRFLQFILDWSRPVILGGAPERLVVGGAVGYPVALILDWLTISP